MQGVAGEIARERGGSTRGAVAFLHLHYVPDNTGPPNAFNSGMALTTSRLILRRWRDADLSAFAQLNDDPAVMEFMPGRLSREESDATAARLDAAIGTRGWGFWAVEGKGSAAAAGAPAAHAGAPFIGFVGLSVPSFESHFTPCREIGWRLAKEYWGFVFASNAAPAILL